MRVTKEVVTRLLFVAHPPQPSDLAVVFGYHEHEGAARRARQGVRLYQAGLVPRLLFTGGAPHQPHEISEAARMANLALAEGVPPEAVLREEASRNTFENVVRSLDLLEQCGLLAGLHRMILVSCPWHMGRVLRRMKQALGERGRTDVGLLSCPQTEECTAADWPNSPVCRLRVLTEFELLHHLIGAGLLPAEH
jgi:uncharacterized SAM-binding protein YcdF (DUF218 family)